MVQNNPQVDLLFSAAQIQRRLQQMAAELAPYVTENTVVVSILNSSFIFSADLVRALYAQGCHFQTDFLGLSSYVDQDQSLGNVTMLQDIKTPVTGRNVLLVDDILDSGRTLDYALAHIGKLEPAEVRAAFLLDKEYGQRPTIPTVIGFSCPDSFVVGYGMDYNQRWRELPYIGVINEL